MRGLRSRRSSTTYLLLDDRNVAWHSGMQLELGPVRKLSSVPLLREDQPWEMRLDNAQPNVWYDGATARWRAWYSAFSTCSDLGAPACSR